MNSRPKTLVVTPWHNADQLQSFLEAWCIDLECPLVHFQQDREREGCAITKNKGIAAAVEKEAEVVVVLDDDCYPTCETPKISDLIDEHLAALEPQRIAMFAKIADPPPRGSPYLLENRLIEYPVAASMGFWDEVPDHCAVRQLATDCAPMTFDPHAIIDRYFPLSGMNLAFRPAEWQPWCRFINVPRFDDIWMGWLWQREAYNRRACFNLAGPRVRHSRQSNVWANLRAEAEHLEVNDTLWRKIATASRSLNYQGLRELLPV